MSCTTLELQKVGKNWIEGLRTTGEPSLALPLLRFVARFAVAMMATGARGKVQQSGRKNSESQNPVPACRRPFVAVGHDSNVHLVEKFLPFAQMCVHHRGVVDWVSGQS